VLKVSVAAGNALQSKDIQHFIHASNFPLFFQNVRILLSFVYAILACAFVSIFRTAGNIVPHKMAEQRSHESRNGEARGEFTVFFPLGFLLSVFAFSQAPTGSY